jgi:hypothetical protein
MQKNVTPNNFNKFCKVLIENDRDCLKKVKLKVNANTEIATTLTNRKKSEPETFEKELIKHQVLTDQNIQLAETTNNHRLPQILFKHQVD